MHAEAVTVCHLKDGKSTVAVPTSCVYTLAVAETGGIEDGLQIWGIRSFLNVATLKKARSIPASETACPMNQLMIETRGSESK